MGDLRNFKASKGVDSIVVLWTANTERYSELQEGVHDNAENILQAIERNEVEIAPSTIFAIACILEGVPFINGSPQNTFVPGAVELAEKHNVLIGGDDFKSGQTKMKSDVVNDMVESNGLLYKPGEHPDHCIVIKYIPNVGDSKRAMDEYTSDIFMGGKNTIVMHNVCEDS